MTAGGGPDDQECDMATRNWTVVPRNRNVRGLRGMMLRPNRSIYVNRGPGLFGGIGLFTVGCIVGGCIGLLFAPRRGVDLRNQLSTNISNRVDTIKSMRVPRLGMNRNRGTDVSGYSHTTGSNDLR